MVSLHSHKVVSLVHTKLEVNKTEIHWSKQDRELDLKHAYTGLHFVPSNLIVSPYNMAPNMPNLLDLDGWLILYQKEHNIGL